MQDKNTMGVIAPENRAQDPSLVKGTISPTQKIAYEIINNQGDFVEEAFNHPIEDIKSPGTMATILKRDWSGEFKINLCMDLISRTRPPENTGIRETYTLSQRGALSIAETCEYVTRCHGGFSTFLTLTCDNDVRKNLDSFKIEVVGEKVAGNWCGDYQSEGVFTYFKYIPKTSIQKEVSRFFDSLNKMFQRGWIDSHGIKHAGNPEIGCREYLHYLWVAESPTNERGEANPHVHCLINWSVPYEHFQEWAARIEKLWGQGYAKLEKLRNKEAAGYYVAKAAGYLTKANREENQGLIRGNRYGIAQYSRAPGWEPILVYAWGILGHLMQERKTLLEVANQPLYVQRNSLKHQLKNTPYKDRARRGRLSALLANTRSEIAKISERFLRFGAVFGSFTALDDFLSWANLKGWRFEKKPPSRFLDMKRKEKIWKQKNALLIQKRKEQAAAIRRVEWGEFYSPEWISARKLYERYEPEFPEKPVVKCDNDGLLSHQDEWLPAYDINLWEKMKKRPRIDVREIQEQGKIHSKQFKKDAESYLSGETLEEIDHLLNKGKYESQEWGFSE